MEISLIPTLCMLNKNWWIFHSYKEFSIFPFSICKLAIGFYMINEFSQQEN